MSLFFAQRDYPQRMNGSARTIAAEGCMLCALTTAHNADVVGAAAELTPATAEAIVRAAGGFTADGRVISDVAGAALSLETRHAERVLEQAGAAALRAALLDALQARHFALVHVDHDERRAGGDHDPDHWVLALRLELEDVVTAHEHRVVRMIVCADSATGGEVRIDADTLQGIAFWGRQRRDYQVRQVQAVRRQLRRA